MTEWESSCSRRKGGTGMSSPPWLGTERPLRARRSCMHKQAWTSTKRMDVNEKKAIRQAVVWEAWGGQTEGDTGWTGPPRRKLLKLLQITLELAKGGIVDLQLLSSLLGSWAFFLQFRRCLYSVIDALYKEGPPRGRQRGTFSVDSSRSQRTDYP